MSESVEAPPAPALVGGAATSAPAPGPWVGPLLGGSVLSALSAGGTWLVEKRQPSPKSLARDFILGAILIVMIMQLLPESSQTLLTGVLALFTTARVAQEAIDGGPVSSGGASNSEEFEVKVGVPRF